MIAAILLLSDGRQIIQRGSISLACRTAAGEWVRVHRQWAVRPGAILRVNLLGKNDWWVDVPTQRVPVARRYHGALRDALFGRVGA